ncbi:thiol-disulfide oxidoreductase DCC family protein [Methylobacterium sp. Leaf118]|uniref:thiol-disulfide oxidoreductase DCC family protein n=1 Tax=Methylobacterium sp. Leaf118 TaxID=2876562 RepID=UPI001E2CC053|nr:DUF393 domain-containing protein [Methylobacterium sp. Leaf118]
MGEGADAEVTVYFDGACPLCRKEIAHYRRSRGAGQVAFVDVGRDAAAPLGPGLTRAAALGRFHLRSRDGQLVSGAAAFARLWRTLPGWRWLGRLIDARILGRRPFLVLAEAAYRLSLPLRPRLVWLLRRGRML